jgi:prevent-host-death family protein
MTESVPLHEALDQMDELADRAVNGEDVVLTRAGKPPVRLVPVGESGDRPAAHGPGKRRLGLAKGKIWMAEDFDETPQWLIDAFHGIDADKPPPDVTARDPGRSNRRKGA